MTAMVGTELRYLIRDKDRFGNERLYVRKRTHRRKIRIKAAFGTPAFWRAYAAAVEALGRPEEAAPVKAAGGAFAQGTFGWLAARYYDSPEFGRLDPQSQRTRRRVIDTCIKEPYSDNDPDAMGNCPLKHLTSKKIKRLRDLKGALPGAANNRKKYLSAMFGWAVEAELMASNPARDVKKKHYATSGFYTWTEAEVTRFEQHYAVGTKPRLALSLFLYLGVRKSDVVRLGPKNIHDPTTPAEPRTIRFVPKKTDYKRSRESVKPILPVLERVLAATPHGEDAFLLNKNGHPFSSKGFANTMRRWVSDAGLPKQCGSHGLRKVGATRCAEGGATEYQMMAIFDWDTPTQATVYIKEANRKRMTMTTAHMLDTPRVH